MQEHNLPCPISPRHLCISTCEIYSGSSGPFSPLCQRGRGVCGSVFPGECHGCITDAAGKAGRRGGMLSGWPGGAEGPDPSHPRFLSSCRWGMPVLPHQNLCDFILSPTPFYFWDVKANVNPSNRNYSQEIPIMYSGALHPNSFKMFPSDFDLFFKTCLQLKKNK